MQEMIDLKCLTQNNVPCRFDVMLNVNDVNVIIFQHGQSPEWLQVPVVAAEQFGVGCADASAVSIDDQLQHVLVHFHHHRRHLLSGHEEDDGEDGNLKLWADTDEGAANWLHQAFPAKLQVQDVVVFIRLKVEKKKWINLTSS